MEVITTRYSPILLSYPILYLSYVIQEMQLSSKEKVDLFFNVLLSLVSYRYTAFYLNNTYSTLEVAGKPRGTVERFLLVHVTTSPFDESSQEHSWHGVSAANQKVMK